MKEKIQEISTLTDITVKKGKISRSDLTKFIEETSKFEEERAATDQHLRAYKRQVDDLRQQLDNQKEKQEKTNKNYDAKVCSTSFLLINVFVNQNWYSVCDLTLPLSSHVMHALTVVHSSLLMNKQ